MGPVFHECAECGRRVRVIAIARDRSSGHATLHRRSDDEDAELCVFGSLRKVHLQPDVRARAAGEEVKP